MLELAREGVQGLVNGLHVDAGQNVLKRLGLTVHGTVDRWLLCRKGERQEHQRCEHDLEEVGSQHFCFQFQFEGLWMVVEMGESGCSTPDAGDELEIGEGGARRVTRMERKEEGCYGKRRSKE